MSLLIPQSYCSSLRFLLRFAFVFESWCCRQRPEGSIEGLFEVVDTVCNLAAVEDPKDYLKTYTPQCFSPSEVNKCLQGKCLMLCELVVVMRCPSSVVCEINISKPFPRVSEGFLVRQNLMERLRTVSFPFSFPLQFGYFFWIKTFVVSDYSLLRLQTSFYSLFSCLTSVLGCLSASTFFFWSLWKYSKNALLDAFLIWPCLLLYEPLWPKTHMKICKPWLKFGVLLAWDSSPHVFAVACDTKLTWISSF